MAKEEKKSEVKVAEGYLVVGISLVKPNDYNPKKDYREDHANRVMFEKVKKSLESHKQIDPIIVRELEDGTYEIINGFHRYMAMTELGYKEIEVKNLGKMSRQQAIAKALSTEAPKIPLDELEVAQLVKEFVDQKFDLTELPYSMDEIEAKIELLDFDWKNFNEQDALEKLDDGKSPVTAVIMTCPKCGHEFKS